MTWCRSAWWPLHRARHTYDPDQAVRAVAVRDRPEPARGRAAGAAAAPAAGDSAGAGRPSRRTGRRRSATRCSPTCAARSPTLPDNQRQVIELLKFEELSVAEVAARLGMTESNVKVTAHRGYRALRRRIEEWTRAD